MGNQHIFIKANNALMEGNYNDFISYCTEDIKWENVGKGTFNGKAELLVYMSSAYDGLTFITENYIREKDIVVEIGQIIFGKNSGSKKSSYCDIWNFKDGMISKVTSFVI